MSPARRRPAIEEEADPEHFHWQTRASFVAERERELVRGAFLPLGARVLDLGCGEGATLIHLGEPEGAVGVDRSEAKVSFARQRARRCRFVRARAEQLPFEAGAFDHVLVRDVIHHLSAPEALVAEAHRVLEPGGRLDVLEPCRYNPLIFLHAVLRPEERGELRSSAGFLLGLLRDRFSVHSVEHRQPLPLHRLLFHPRLGQPSLARQPLIRGAVDGVERLAGRALPRPAWAYLHLRATRRLLPADRGG
ncbi:MAG: class I SAM-dependent methyltransferase [Deltaproteobacteria bacterium]|jgi:SAM-dependent methyltransferase|nr:class I SAM-dependent methyltransferase [Deltaproteobacteria bacterium]MBW2532993.1 class I SAM-dependent methyltransferase [Deltaproteobacteria bacterium]